MSSKLIGIMARSTKPKSRVEPRFVSAKETVRVSAKDRVSQSKAPLKKSTKTTHAKKPKKKKKPVKKKSDGFWLWRGLRLMFRPLPKVLYWGSVATLWGLILVVGIFGYYATKLPSANTWAIPERPPNIKIVAIDNSLISNRGLTGGKALRLEDMSPYIPQAVIAIEDRRFHAHFGFDPIGFARAMSRNILSLRLRQGGSTITQQLAKNLFLKPERTFGRKVQELILAFWLEANYSKADILELYLNRVYFGAGATGVNAAARRYFGKSAKQVTIGEAALLAGLLKAPSRYTPAKNPELAQRRARVVLQAMQREGYVKPGSINIEDMKPGEHAQHFRSGPEHFIADMVVKEVRSLIGDLPGDVVVKTTIDSYLLTAAHAILTDALNKHGKKRNVSQVALVALAPDGAIRSLIGGRNYGDSQFNRAVDAKRQPGSAFKPFVWLTALERGKEPNSIYVDEPVAFGKWRPQNYDQEYRGEVTLDEALSLSLNTIAAKLTVEAGSKNIAYTAARMGIKSKLKTNASLGLGTSEVNLLELTSAYAPFANGGLRARPYLIQSITTDAGKILFQRNKDVVVRAVKKRELRMMNVMLQNVMLNGTGKAAFIKKHPAGGKTGTSQNFRDALFIGHTAHLITGIWFGNDDNSPTKKITGGSLPAKTWRDFMGAAHLSLKVKQLPGQPIYTAGIMKEIPIPTFRPSQQNIDGANLRDDLKTRVNSAIQKKPKKSILDMILNR
ncbi:MAG: transglycosylase domain-containing protein [Rhizobiaceae bacterium]